jgi:hypothetical protein
MWRTARPAIDPFTSPKRTVTCLRSPSRALRDIDPDKYAGCMETKETSPLEKGVVEHKYYCLDAGLVLIKELKGKTVRTELVDVTH